MPCRSTVKVIRAASPYYRDNAKTSEGCGNQLSQPSLGFFVKTSRRD